MAYKENDKKLRYERNYYHLHKEKRLERQKKKYLENREEILRKKKENYTPHPRRLKTTVELRFRRKEWEDAHKEKRNEYMRVWNLKNRDRLLPYRKQYYRTRLSLNSQYSRFVASARERKHEQVLSKEQFIQIVSLPCKYCNESIKRIGIDRLDNSIGYNLGNSIPCCKTCNYMKKTSTLQEFLSHIEKIYLYNKK